MITQAALLAAGYVPNRNAWIGDGWIYCKGHEAYAFHTAYSKPGDAAVFEICLECNEYHGTLELKGSPMPVAADILANAKEFTERYAQGILKQPRQSNIDPASIGVPERVFVLLQSNVVLGVLSKEQKALDEAHSLMNTYGGTWVTMATDRIWRGGNGVYIEISAHDVR